MSVNCKFVNQPYNETKDLQYLIHYALHDNITGNYLNWIGGINVNPYRAFEEMMWVKRYFRKTSGRQLKHIIISFDRRTDFSPRDLVILAAQISTYYSPYFQIVYGVHTDTNNLHIHFIMNSVSYIDGKMYSGGIEDLESFKQYVNYKVFNYQKRIDKRRF